MDFKTTDICDQHSDKVQMAEINFRDFGGRTKFCGQIVTVKAFEDNSKVRECVASPGAGKVLVVDGGASLRRAMLGDLLAQKAADNEWSGILINGCIRDSAEIGKMPMGVKALGTHPCKTEKRDLGEVNVQVRFAGVDFVPGHWLYADEDGVIVSAVKL